MRSVILNGTVIAIFAMRILVITLFQRQDCRYAVTARIGITDKSGTIAAGQDHIIIINIAQIANKRDKSRLIKPNAKIA